MNLPRRFGLFRQLLLGFIACGGLILLISYSGNTALEKTTKRLDATLEWHVRPLALLHSLQSKIGTLRNRELEIPHQRDIFVVQTQAMRMRAEIADFDGELNRFNAVLIKDSPADARRLAGYWHDYRGRLEAQLRRIAEMDLAGARLITESGTLLPFHGIQGLLAAAAKKTEAGAETAYRQMVEEQDALRHDLLKLILTAGSIIFFGLAYSGRVVVRRINVLRAHALRLAQGKEDENITLARCDEIGDLAGSFELMRAQIRSRESALEAARNELEQRVMERTSDLEHANRRLIRFSQVAEQNPVGILIARIGGKVEFVNPAYERIFGRPAADLVGLSLQEVMETSDPVDAETALRIAMNGGIWETEQPGRRDTDTYWERLRLAPVHDENKQITHLLLAREDISEQRRQMEKITHQAHYDMLTGLPNRVLATERLQQAINRCRRERGSLAILYLDLDNFKEVNDTLGHATGDQLLKQASVRLVGALRAGDVVARLGGDEFLVFPGQIDGGESAAAIAEQVIAAFAAPFTVEDRGISTSPSIGIALYPEDGADPMVLLRNADLAMYEAKESGRNTFRYYNKSIHEQSLRRLEIGRCLRGALERDELHVAYHPLVLAESGRVIGAEALLRWNSPELGNISPGEFIPVAEQNGLIVDIGRWVLREACATLSRWQVRQEGFVMAVNVSPRQFRARGFFEMVRNTLTEFGLPPNRLEIEITEGVLLRNQDEVRSILGELHALGVRLSMDDFGTGYSSLSYLREFPFHTVKIDRSFVRDVTEDSSDRALIVAAIRMAQALGLQIVAEGVEHQAQWSFLAENECDILQGFHFGQPVSEHAFDARWVNALVAPPLPVAPATEKT